MSRTKRERAFLMNMVGGGAAAATYQSTIAVIPNLIAYWPLNETSGTVANDVGGSAYHGTYVNATLNNTAGPGASMGNAPRFDGTGDYVSFPADFLAVTTYRDTGSLSMWLKPVAYAQYAFRLFETNQINILVRLVSGTRLDCNRNGADNVDKIAQINPGSTADWFHLAMTWQIAANGLKAYFNGVVGATTATPSAAGTGALSATGSVIGAASTTANFYNGYIAHVALYSRVLTAPELTTLATAI